MFEDPTFDLGLDKAESKVFDQMERDMREARQWLEDPAVFRLAHPARVAATPAAAPDITLITMAESRSHRMVRELLTKQLGTINIFEALESANDRRLRSFWLLHTGTAEVTGGFGNGSAGPTMHAMRFALAGGRVYSFTERAIALLEKTHLSTDIPVSELLNLPAPNIYIERGRTRDHNGHALNNSQSGLHPLEGAYVSSVVDSSGRARLEVTLTGSPVGRDDPMDDAVEWTSMRADGEMSVTDALTEAYTKSTKLEL